MHDGDPESKFPNLDSRSALPDSMIVSDDESLRSTRQLYCTRNCDFENQASLLWSLFLEIRPSSSEPSKHQCLNCITYLNNLNWIHCKRRVSMLDQQKPNCPNNLTASVLNFKSCRCGRSCWKTWIFFLHSSPKNLKFLKHFKLLRDH